MDVVIRVPADGSLVERHRAEGAPVTLPSEYNEYAVWVETLRSSGLLEYLHQVVLARRAGAFELIDLVLFLGCFFSASSSTKSIADFAEESREYGPELAAIGGRARWLTQASISRGLAAVSEAGARELVRRMFAMTGQAILDSKLCDEVGYRDGTGAGWRVFHWDATADTVRKRALPESEELPPGVRLSEELARPGYAGRKRGEGVFSRSIVSDATSSVWVHMDLGSGSGSVREQLALAVDDTVAYLGGCRQALAQSVMVCDGVAGGLPQTRAVLSGGMQILTRLAHYECLQTEKAQKLMQKGRWVAVDDSRSGPRREAIELGTRIVDGHRLRVIASRFSVDKTKRKNGRGAGTTIGEWHYELFLSSLPPQRWAANDLVTLYYGRTAIENRFAAEDRTFNLSRVFSFCPPGQLLAMGIAMAIWNLRVVAGLASVPETTPTRPLRPRRDVDVLEELPVQVTESVAPSELIVENVLEPDTNDAAQLDEALVNEVAEEWCNHQPDWSVEANTLRCPAGTLLQRSTRVRYGNLMVRFRAPPGACLDCPMRARCTTSRSPQFKKEVLLSLGFHPAEDAAFLDEPAVEIRDTQTRLPRFLPDAPILAPPALQRTAIREIRTATLTVIAPELQSLPPLEEHFVPQAETRQRRRQSIVQRIAANARPEQAATVTVHAPPSFVSMLERTTASVRSA